MQNPYAKSNSDRVLVSAYIGEIHDGEFKGRNNNKQISLLQGAALKQSIGGREVTRDLLLDCIVQLCEEAGSRLDECYADNRVILTSADFRQIDDQHACICEDSRLSFQFIGQPFNAYILDATKIPMLDNRRRQIWLDTLSSFAIFDKQLKWSKVETKELRALEDAVKTMNLEQRLSEDGNLSNLGKL